MDHIFVRLYKDVVMNARYTRQTVYFSSFENKFFNNFFSYMYVSFD